MGARTPWATLLTQYADNTSGEITAERLRNFVQSARPHTAAADPTVNSDSTAGFDVGHAWVNTSTPAVFECVDASAGAAVWVQVYPQEAAAPAWGEITGTLANQTDLQTALDGKAATGHSHTLSDVTDSGGAAALDVGTTTGTVAAGDDSRITGAVQTSRQVATQHSLDGGGDLTTDRTLSLVGDVAAPGNNKVYGTDGAGARAWKDDPAGGSGDVTGPASSVDGNLAVFDGATGKLLKDGGKAVADFAPADGFTHMVSLTQAEYDALTPDASTIYFIRDA